MDNSAIASSASLCATPGARLTVVVTGGAGFLGSHLCQHLVNQGRSRLLRRQFPHRPARERRRARGEWSLRGRRTRHRRAVRPQASPFRSHLQSRLPGIAAALPGRCRPDGLICSQGTYNCLQAAKRSDARVFHASTSEIYGDPEIHPQTEAYHGNVNTVGPRSCYDEGKRFAETLVTDYGRHHGLVTRMARIFNTYGPRMQPDDGRVVSNFVVQALLGRDITVYGSGEQTRSFCYVSDLIDGFARLMANGDAPLGPVNLGNPVETTVGELARRIIDLVGSRSKIDPQEPARRRSAPPAAGHHPGEGRARLVADRRSHRRPAADDRALRRSAAHGQPSHG